MFHERFGRECAPTAQKQRILLPFRPTDRSRARFELSNTSKNNVFYKLFDRPTDRPNRSIQRDTRKNYVFYEPLGLEDASDAPKRFGRTETACFTSVSDASALRPLKTTYFTTVSTDRPIASALRAFEHTQKQCILQAFRSTDRSTESLDPARHSNKNVFY